MDPATLRELVVGAANLWPGNRIDFDHVPVLAIALMVLDSQEGFPKSEAEYTAEMRAAVHAVTHA